MTTIGTVEKFEPEKNDFDDWINVFKSFLLANGLDYNSANDQKRCMGIFISSIGIETVSLLNNLISPAQYSDKKLEELVTVLKAHFKPPPKALAERFKFSARKQKPGETSATFLAELRKLAITCKFDATLSEKLRDQFIFGLANETAQRRIFTREDTLSLEDALKIAVSQDAAELGTSTIRDANTHGGVNYASASRPHRRSPAQFNRNSGPASKFASNSKGGRSHGRSQGKGQFGRSQSGSFCPNCGSTQHKTAKECPHKNASCFACGKMGHFRKYCRSSRKNAHTIAVEDDSSLSNVNSIYQGADNLAEYTIDVLINGISHPMEFDSGCKNSLLSEDFWRKKLGAPPLTKTNAVFRTFTNQRFRPLGKLDVTLGYNGQSVNYSFSVTKGSQSLFGRDLIRLFGLNLTLAAPAQCHRIPASSQKLTLDELLDEYKDVFSPPRGSIIGFKAKVILKDDAVPKFLKARPIPFALRSKVDAELDHMEQSGVIQRIEHSEWASPLVVVPKANGRVRITGDFKHTVNSQLNITQYPLQRVDELMSAVSGGFSFSRLDGPDAFHQIELDESSKSFMVINTHRGLYRYKVLPQGIASSPAIFQEFMDKLLKGIPMAGSFMDDSICTGITDAEHLATLQKIFQRMRETNYRLSKSKCLFLQKSLEYIGFVISKDGLTTSPGKVKAVHAIQRPQTVTEVKSFLGLVNFYGKFIPNLADKCAELYALTRKDVDFKWTNKCQIAFDGIKKSLSSAPILCHHSPELPIGISCDASQKGLGAVLFHRFLDNSERPIAFASKVLSPAEQRYSQIEKEALAIVFGVKKFFQFLCGREFTVVTDHQPLLSLFGAKAQVPSFTATRLQKWSLFLSQFTFSMQYRRTADHGNADALSRHPTPTDGIPEVEPEVESEVNLVACSTLEVLPVTARAIKNVTSRDGLLSTVYRHVSDGWPVKMQKTDPLYPFFLRREELTLVQDIILWGIRVVIPAALQKKILLELHDSHSGIVRMKSLARQYVWWPGIDEEIESMCKSCTKCVQNRGNPPSAPLHPWEFPERPWQHIHIDLAGPFLDKMWLIITDAHSKWPEVFDLNNNATSFAVISKIRESICRFGLVDQIVSDNGRQFTSQEFKSFCDSNGIRHTTSSVYHPRSNGEVERFIQTFKKSLKAAEGDRSLALQRFLFTYRVTPHATTGQSPAELLQGRKLRTLLDLLRPDVRAKVGYSQFKQSANYDKKTREREFHIGQRIWVKTFSKNEPKWSSGIIRRQTGPVTFIVDVNGQEIKRHADQLLHGPTQDIMEEDEQERKEEVVAEPMDTAEKPVPQPEPPLTPVPPRYPKRERPPPGTYKI